MLHATVPARRLRPTDDTTPRYTLSTATATMADVNMTDAPAPKAKVAKAGASSGDDKKRFEVKKVGKISRTRQDHG